MDCALLLLSLCALVGSASLQAAPEGGTSDECPERLLGNERRRTCPKPCQQDKDCGNKRQCLCDGQCGLSCVAPGRACPWPLTPLNNSVARLLSPTPSFSALLQVRCDPGFKLPNGLDAAIRRCQGDRQWSGDDPICTGAQTTSPTVAPTSPLVLCPLPDEVVDTFSIEGNAAVGTSILYSCLSGSELVGSGVNFCHSNQTWHYPHPICPRVFCVPPREVEHGYVVAVQKIEYELNFDIHYLCKKNFLLDGSKQITCLSSGSWSSDPPYCRARCPIPAERSRVLIGGLKRWPYDVTDAVVPHGEKVSFFCKHPRKQCSFTQTTACFDGTLSLPPCYLEPTWFQYKLFPHRLVSELDTCYPDDME